MRSGNIFQAGIAIIIAVFLVSPGSVFGQAGGKTHAPVEGNTADTIPQGEVFNAMTIRWKNAYDSGDATNLLRLYSEDARYISSHVPGLVAIGRDNVTAYFQAGISFGGHIDSITIDRMDLSCEIATLFCTYQATNSGVTVTGHNLMVLRKTGGGWLIILHMTVV